MINFLLTPLYMIHFFIFKLGDDFLEDVFGQLTPVIQGVLSVVIPTFIVLVSSAHNSFFGVMFAMLFIIGLLYSIHVIVYTDFTQAKLKRNNKIVWRKILRRNYCEMKIDKYGDCLISKKEEMKDIWLPRTEKWNSR